MALPFTQAQFLEVFAQYNLAVWPSQIFLFMLALLIVGAVFLKTAYRTKIILYGLGFLWFWTAIFYHITFFSKINVIAWGFAALFIIQGTLFIILAYKDGIKFAYKNDMYGILGSIMLAYALVIYPILNSVFGHGWPYNPSFGLPCPVTIFTFGMLLWTTGKIPRYILIIPLLWALIGVSAAINLGIWEDTLLAVSGILATWLLWRRTRK